MACPPINSGSQFLTTLMGHIDCQARNIGSYGYGALADPESAVSIALTGLLIIFVAIFGMRLLAGYAVDGRDAAADLLKVGIVLLLATSWPAWRVIGYEVVLDGPAEVARWISQAPGSTLSNVDLIQRLQNTDDGLVAITTMGSGRLPGADLREEFRGIALADETGLAWGRVIFLLAVVGPYAIVRLGAGILLCLTPLLAGTLLFASSRSLFHGWIRGLVFAMLGSLSLSLLHAISLEIFEPWVETVIALRNGGANAPSAPTEMAVMALSFGLTTLGTLFLIARVTFLPFVSLQNFFRGGLKSEPRLQLGASQPELASSSNLTRSRAAVITDSVATAVRRESLAGLPCRSGTAHNQTINLGRGDGHEAGIVPHESGTRDAGLRRERGRSTATGARRDKKL